MKPLVLLLVVFLAQALAQQVPTKPFLRIEAQMHTAPIWRIAVGFADTPTVEVYSAIDLGLLYKAETSDFKDCDFAVFSFSEGYLYAGIKI